MNATYQVTTTEADLDALEAKAERQARDQARRLGYRIAKSRARNPRDITFGGYMLIGPDGTAMAGGESPGYTLSLDDIVGWLDEYEAPSM